MFEHIIAIGKPIFHTKLTWLSYVYQGYTQQSQHQHRDSHLHRFAALFFDSRACQMFPAFVSYISCIIPVNSVGSFIIMCILCCQFPKSKMCYHWHVSSCVMPIAGVSVFAYTSFRQSGPVQWVNTHYSPNMQL